MTTTKRTTGTTMAAKDMPGTTGNLAIDFLNQYFNEGLQREYERIQAERLAHYENSSEADDEY